MGQQDIINVLKKNKKPLGCSDIAKKLNVSTTSVSHLLAKMFKRREIKVIEINAYQAMELYNCDRRMRLYYI